jgi:hypothetical protein
MIWSAAEALVLCLQYLIVGYVADCPRGGFMWISFLLPRFLRYFLWD